MRSRTETPRRIELPRRKGRRGPLVVPGAEAPATTAATTPPTPLTHQPTAERDSDDSIGTQANISRGFKRMMSVAAKRTGRTAKFCTEEACLAWLSKNGPGAPVPPQEPDTRTDVDKIGVQTWISLGVKRLMVAATKGRTLKHCIDEACKHWLIVNGSTPS